MNLVSDISAGDGKTATLFLQCIHHSIISGLQAGEAQGMPVEAQLVADVVLQNK